MEISRSIVSSRLRRRAPLVLTALVAVAIAAPIGAFASHQFTDVLDSNPFHADIDALADSGVTSGCGTGIYCPEAYVTREQMAAFLNRLGALAPNKTPVVNADKVDGYHANALVRSSNGSDTSSPALPTLAGSVTYGSVSLTAPSTGYVLIHATATARADTCASACTVAGGLLHVQGSALSTRQFQTAPGADTYVNIAIIERFPVAAGAQTFEIRLSKLEANSTMRGWFSEMTATFVPFGGVGTLPVVPSVATPQQELHPITKEPLAP